MSLTESVTCQPPLSLLELLTQYGWKPVRDRGGDEVAGLCPLHQETHPSFYVNRSKQVFYCHGCGRGGGLAQLQQLLDRFPLPAADDGTRPPYLDVAYRFYQRQLLHYDHARTYLARRGIQDWAVIEGMRIGYAPGACLRRYLERRGYAVSALRESGLIDEQGRDWFFRSITFPLPLANNLYGRSLGNGIGRHRFLPGSKGGLYRWAETLAFPRVIVVEGLFDVGALWQAGFPNTVCALGSYLNPLQLSQLCRAGGPAIYICFDADRNGSGQRAARRLSIQLLHAGVESRRVELPVPYDPASFFAAGGTACAFQRCLDRARP